MRAYILIASIGVSLLTGSAIAQMENRAKIDHEQALLAFDSILTRSDEILDIRKRVSVRAKAANMLFPRDRETARDIFIKLWEQIDKQPEEEASEKEAARIDLLEHLFPKDRALAEKLMNSVSRVNSKEAKEQGLDFLKGVNPETQRMAFLAYRFAEENPTLSATLLGSISRNTAPSLPIVLARIREKEPVLANYITGQILDRFPNHPSSIALLGLTNVAAYLFPMQPTAVSLDVATSDDQLRSRFMQVGYEVLKNSLQESAESLKAQDLDETGRLIRASGQATVAAILYVLSSRYSPQDSRELGLLAPKLLRSVPPEFHQLITMQAAAVRATLAMVEDSENLEVEIVAAIAKEDYAKAEELIDKIKETPRRKNWLDILFRSQSRNLIRRGDALLALSAARKIESPYMALPLLIDIAKLGHKKKDEGLSTNAFQAILTLLEKLPKGAQAKTLLSVSAETGYFMKEQSSLAMQRAVEIINALETDRSEKASKAVFRGENYWENPDHFLSTPSLISAFAVNGENDLTETLRIAERFREKSLRMLATLAAIEPIIKKGPPKTNKKERKK